MVHYECYLSAVQDADDVRRWHAMQGVRAIGRFVVRWWFNFKWIRFPGAVNRQGSRDRAGIRMGHREIPFSNSERVDRNVGRISHLSFFLIDGST